MKNARATTLFAVPGFFRGMAASLDLGNTLSVYNESRTGKEADARAIYSDWAAVGDDIRFAIHEWEVDYGEKK